jgi:hypothetical protein
MVGQMSNCIKLVKCGGKEGVLTEEKGEEKAYKSLCFPPNKEVYIQTSNQNML